MPSSIVLVDQLTLTMLKELVSHMDPLANTSGPLLMVFMNRHLSLLKYAPVSLGVLVELSLVPTFVGQNYFCESITSGYRSGVFYPNGDPLWDGQECGPTSSCCTFNSPPWFNVQLPNPTTDDIEVRICSDHGTVDGDTPIQLIELFVK